MDVRKTRGGRDDELLTVAAPSPRGILDPTPVKSRPINTPPQLVATAEPMFETEAMRRKN
jgi:hypothetical protein